MGKKTIEALVSGGKATAGPPLGPSLGPLGVNVAAIVNKINEITKDFAGMKVPVKVTVDEATKEFTVEIGVPPSAALIVRELAVEKGSGTPNAQKVGNLTIQQLVKLARLKMPETYAKTLKAAAKEIIGTCVSLGATVEGKDPKDVYAEIEEGVYQKEFEAEA